MITNARMGERRLMSILDYLIDSEIDEDCTYDGEIDTYYE